MVRQLIRRWPLDIGRAELVRGLLRSDRPDAETKLGSVALLGLVTSPFVLARAGILIWWLLTGRRLPGWLGRQLGHPITFLVSTAPHWRARMPVELRAVLDERDQRQRVAVD
jgi:hypothetical protein